jgi:two-component system sensor histidine kinase KdpD
MVNSRGERFDVWFPVGAFGALVISVALVPLREVTSASNLAFVFLPWTILVAELGGRGPGLITALVAAMGLDFFLTEPYLTLTISKTDDVIAFVALAICGLIAAAFGGRRERSSAAASRAHTYQDALGQLVTHIDRGDPLHTTLEDLRRAFGIGRMVIRDGDGRVLAAAPSEAAAALEPPAVILEPRTLSPASDTTQRWGPLGFRLPAGGGRLPLSTAGGAMFLELWEGAPDGLSLEARRTLSIAATILKTDLAAKALTAPGR